MSMWLALVLLPCYDESLLILEASEQAVGTWPSTMPHFQTATALGSLASSSSISAGSFSPTTGVHTRF